jgi:hypothetical protein
MRITYAHKNGIKAPPEQMLLRHDPNGPSIKKQDSASVRPQQMPSENASVEALVPLS